eukprot:766620-Hanusia_phi.AAC.2
MCPEDGETHAIISVMLLPPMESMSSWVSFESRKGTLTCSLRQGRRATERGEAAGERGMGGSEEV